MFPIFYSTNQFASPNLIRGCSDRLRCALPIFSSLKMLCEDAFIQSMIYNCNLIDFILLISSYWFVNHRLLFIPSKLNVINLHGKSMCWIDTASDSFQDDALINILKWRFPAQWSSQSIELIRPSHWFHLSIYSNWFHPVDVCIWIDASISLFPSNQCFLYQRCPRRTSPHLWLTTIDPSNCKQQCDAVQRR